MSDIAAMTSAPGVSAPILDRAPAGRLGPDVAARQVRFDELSATVLDKSGTYTDGQRTEAYQALHTLSVTGQLIGVGPERAKVLDQVTFDSDIGQRSQALQRSFVEAVNAGAQAGGAQGALQAVAARFDSLSATDQDILFQTSLNAADRTGAKPYADVQGWRDNVQAQLKVVSFMKDAGVVGVNGALDQRAATTKAADDPKFAAVLKLSLRRDNNSAGWTQSVLQLFGADAPKDSIRLSDAARKYLGERAQGVPAQAPATVAPAPYRQGSIVSKVA